MKKITLLGLLAILAISIEGCTIGSKNKESTTPKPTTTKNLSATPNQSKEAEKESDNTRPQRVSGLIPATNPDVRVSGSVRGRQDPFALVSIKPEIKKVEKGSRRTSEGNFPRSRRGNTVPTIDSLSDPDSLGNQAKNSGLILAEQVIVTGIAKLNGRTKVIVKAPDEAYARHVGIGEYVSNGKVLVKRVEGLNSATPKVILQQKGVEIRKAIGEQPAIENAPDADITARAINKLPSQPVATSETWLSHFLSGKLKDRKNN